MASSSRTAADSWNTIWEQSQPTLNSIHESLSQQSAPSPRVTRIGKLDAELLDQELVQVLQDPLNKAISLISTSLKGRFDPELTLLIQLTLYKFSLWDTGATYGAKLQGLRYAWLRGRGDTPPTFRIPRRLLFAHGAITMLIPYIHTRIRAHALSQAWPDAPSSDKRRKAWEVLTKLESLHSSLALVNFVAFLWDGGYRTLADRLLQMRLVSTQRVTTRDVSYEFMNRQMVWHAFTEFLLFLLPLINTRAVGRRLTQLTSKITLSSLLPAPVKSACGIRSDVHSKSSPGSRKGKYWSLPLDQCAICSQDSSTNLADPATALSSLTTPNYTSHSGDPPEETEDSAVEPPSFPINTPYVTNCGHVYCYVCITGRMIRIADEASGSGPGGTRWECLRCEEEVTGVERVEAVVEESEYGSEGDVSFEYGSDDLDFTDMSSSSVADDSESLTSE